MLRFFLAICMIFVSAQAYDFNFIKKHGTDNNNTLLVIGGIHGNEPGGYFSAEILASHYKIKSGNLWIVPNLNARSIQADKRGVFGDMNRKFSTITKNDPDFDIVSDIKKIILDKNVTLIINLHDGHGFYRNKNLGTIFNPKAWGQTCVIDQCNLKNSATYNNMDKIATKVKENINKSLIENHHIFNVKNTNTKFDDEEMRHSLTYFAVTHNKPAFAIETSKNLSSLSQKVYYQLNAIEEFMTIMNIKFERDFKLDSKDITNIINDYGSIIINGNILLDLRDIKKSLSFIPLQWRNNDFVFSSSIGSVKTQNGSFDLYVGNKKITTLHRENFSLCKKSDNNVSIEVDGKVKQFKFASEFFVNDDFKVVNSNNLRVNVIGFTDKTHKNESGLTINYKSLDKNYSIDNHKKRFRIEFYDKSSFCGMILVNFR
ncbi:M99 family carboxypeptidase catalytic domain-containing protein [Sulfurimonas sp. HSL-1716]|uniref:M99 family carboxypeptidase catalytic domain-containing protein n=1 Tax=Hydrocurvibacter sulfurireducens TaxID=3131937 RepID=UPI0031F8A9D9